MTQQVLRHGFTTASYLWVVMTVAIGLALGRQAAGAKECHRETPLPADVRLIAPGLEVPEALARFAGAWTGEWELSGGLCHTLVVEEVLANGYARLIVSHGTAVGTDARLPEFLRVTGRIVDGELGFHSPGPERHEFAYRVAGETLHGTYNDRGRVSLTRVTDVGQVGCGPQAGGLH